MRPELRPRQYAWRIYHLPTVEDRRKALEEVPERWRDWVAWYVADWFARHRGR